MAIVYGDMIRLSRGEEQYQDLKEQWPCFVPRTCRSASDQKKNGTAGTQTNRRIFYTL